MKYLSRSQLLSEVRVSRILEIIGAVRCWLASSKLLILGLPSVSVCLALCVWCVNKSRPNFHEDCSPLGCSSDLIRMNGRPRYLWPVVRC